MKWRGSVSSILALLIFCLFSVSPTFYAYFFFFALFLLLGKEKEAEK